MSMQSKSFFLFVPFATYENVCHITYGILKCKEKDIKRKREILVETHSATTSPRRLLTIDNYSSCISGFWVTRQLISNGSENIGNV